MIKNLLLFLCLILLSNCASPTSAFLGPIFTGAKTGSIYQASLSYGSNKIIDEFKSKNIVEKFNKLNIVKLNEPYAEKNPIILLSYKVSEVYISEVYEPEPLP